MMTQSIFGCESANLRILNISAVKIRIEGGLGIVRPRGKVLSSDREHAQHSGVHCDAVLSGRT